ncbi:MAG TPA: enoyl-CoA hydratase/isomerase family protein [Solirubrobacterales bacterium]|jgi:enoyl-CoA hydratase/carnithine racemase|nr:enoyl-CoA hydratase/isomerase family protein [Solirubrobacterales bacterium]
MSTITTSRDGRVLTVRVDNPPHNFMNRHMVAELDELTRGLEDDRSIGAVVITGGSEDRFITHYDVAEILAGTEAVGMQVSSAAASATLQAVRGMSRLPGGESAVKRTPAAGLLELHGIHDLFNRIGRLDKVFIAAINGPALGGGCELSLACDLRYIASAGGPIGLPELTLGFNPGAGGTQRLTHLIGPGAALEMILEARALTPDEALEVGLVNRVVPPGDLLTEATATAERMARRAPISVAAAKRAVREGATLPLAAGLAIERKWFLACGSKPASHRAMRAYVDQVEREGAPWSNPEMLEPWREGTVVDLTTD